MKSRLTIVILVLFSISAAVIFVATSSQSQIKDGQDKSQSDGSAPTVNFNAPEAIDQQERSIRNERGRKYKSRIPLDKMEDQANVFEDPLSHSPVEPAFPIKQGNLIVRGTITNSQAFISNDKSAVYSEFEVTVNQVFKNGTNEIIGPESRVVAERVGGNVRFPSGRVQRRGDSGRNLPQIGKEYVLFLKWDKQGKDYLILTGYEIRGETVYPLDGLKDGNLRIFNNYARYKNVSLIEFVGELQASIANLSQGGER